MKKLRTVFIDKKSTHPLQVQLSDQLKAMIQTGQVSAGDCMPSTRDLAAQLKISRNTVVYAYDRLIGEGYLDSHPRSGVYVSQSAHELRSAIRRSDRQKEKQSARFVPMQEFPQAPKPFRPCQPDVGLFPLPMWNRLRGRMLRGNHRNLLMYNSQFVLGFRALRENVAAYVRDSRGVACEWWQIAITSGSQQALYFLAHLLLKPDDRVIMEDPGYLGAVRAWEAVGARIAFAHVDEQGLRLPAEGVQDASVIYVTPSRQFPTGASLSLPRRLALIKGAIEAKAWIIEDDYDSEFQYDAPALPSLQSLDSGRCVIYVGTFSKILFPSLRLGYAVLPQALIDPFTALKSTAEDHGPIIDQATLAAFLESGAFYSHIRRCRRNYAERQNVFLDHIDKYELPLDFRYRNGGMNLTGFLPRHINDREWSLRLKKAGLDIPALSSYARGVAESGLVFGFTAFSPAQIRKALEQFARLRPASIQ